MSWRTSVGYFLITFFVWAFFWICSGFIVQRLVSDQFYWSIVTALAHYIPVDAATHTHLKYVLQGLLVLPAGCLLRVLVPMPIWGLVISAAIVGTTVISVLALYVSYEVRMPDVSLMDAYLAGPRPLTVPLILLIQLPFAYGVASLLPVRHKRESPATATE